MRRTLSLGLFALVIVAGLVLASAQGWAQQAPTAAKTPGGNVPGRDLIVFGDLSIFWGPSKPKNCNLNNRYKHGEPVGWRIGRRSEDRQACRAGGGADRAPDVRGRDAETSRCGGAQRRSSRNGSSGSPSGSCPIDAPTGIVRFTVTAKDKFGRTGEFKPFDVDASQLTIVE